MDMDLPNNTVKLLDKVISIVHPNNKVLTENHKNFEILYDTKYDLKALKWKWKTTKHSIFNQNKNKKTSG